MSPPNSGVARGPAVAMRSITKRFASGVLACDSIDLDVEAGSIHALLGENGAGKTTLCRVLFGELRPDAGAIEILSQRVSIASPSDALALGIGMVHQRFVLCERLSALDNCILGAEPRRGPFVSRVEARRRVSAVAAENGFSVDLNARASQLAAGQRQALQVLSLLYRDARILIFDEPTSVLTPVESDRLFRTIRTLARSGRACIYVTHRMGELPGFADRVTVLRRGRVVASLEAGHLDEKELAALVAPDRPRTDGRAKAVPRETVCELAQVSTPSKEGRTGLSNVTLSLHRGEILGVAGVVGNGQDELVDVVLGLQRPKQGSIRFAFAGKGRPVAAAPRERVAYIPSDPNLAAIADMSIADNLLLGRERERRFRRGPIFRRRECAAYAAEAISQYGVVASSASAPARSLSSGNLRKVILARELGRDADVVVAADPTTGLDVRSARDVRARLADAARGGAAVLLVSSDLDEIFDLADRIAVMRGGAVVMEGRAEEVGRPDVALAMMSNRTEAVGS